MSVTFIIFIVSGGLIVALLATKAFQEKYEVLLFWPYARQYVERFLQKKYSEVTYYFSHVTQKHFYIVLHYLVVRGKKFFADMHKKLDERSHHLVSLIQGKQYIETDRKASPFLHDMSNFRDNFRSR